MTVAKNKESTTKLKSRRSLSQNTANPCQPRNRFCASQQRSCLRVDDGHLDLDSGLDGDGGDLLHDVRGGVQVDQALVDAQLEAVVGVGTLTSP